MTEVHHWAASHPGTVRTSNQDAFLCRPDLALFAVADGVGGSEGGAHASLAVVRALDGIPGGLAASELLATVRSTLEDTHRTLLDHAAGLTTAATTVVVLLLHGDHLACLWAGDSRAYLYRRGALHRLTSDHSMVGDMLRAGMLTEAEAEQHPRSNVITRAIGVGTEEALLDKAIGHAEADDRFLLCSDGLTKALGETEIARLLRQADPARSLVDEALSHLARDNVTALVLAVANPDGPRDQDRMVLI